MYMLNCALKLLTLEILDVQEVLTHFIRVSYCIKWVTTSWDTQDYFAAIRSTVWVGYKDHIEFPSFLNSQLEVVQHQDTYRVFAFNEINEGNGKFYFIPDVLKRISS